MTPEDKAWDLVNYYITLSQIRNSKINGKRASIRCCNEIIQVLKIFDKPTRYWERVIEEINKL